MSRRSWSHGPADRIAVKAADLERGADAEGALPGATGGDLNAHLGLAGKQECSEEGQQMGVKQLVQQFAEAV